MGCKGLKVGHTQTHIPAIHTHKTQNREKAEMSTRNTDKAKRKEHGQEQQIKAYEDTDTGKKRREESREKERKIL